ncbi:response regulator [Legionella tunisiensis]|uniref:response regulator n=1 Tax=Legionella tunisiensis TaxID=1034944 RepID=UPI0002FC2FF5|nr:response regulator [Legionella tunisiensis]
MRVLIVEDGAFNAFCLTRLLEGVCQQAQVTVVRDSLSALNYLTYNTPSLVIVDGYLSAGDGLNCHGPALVDALWQTNPHLPVIAWSDCENMRQAFAEIFKQYNKPFNEYTCWTKVVSHERIRMSLPYLLAQGSGSDSFKSLQLREKAEILHA